jgi:hypothetical protein
LRRRLWWIGTGAAVVGYAFQALALAFGSILLVAPLLVSALLFALPMSARLAHRRVSRAEWGWAGLLTFSLAVFVALARTTASANADAQFRALVAAGISVVIVTGCVLIALRWSDWRRAILLGAAVGVLFGMVAVLTKIVMYTFRTGTLLHLLASPVLYLLIVLGVVATLLQQSAFHAGSLRTSVPAMLVLEPVIAVLLGEVVLGEHLAVSTPSAIVLGIAAAAMTAATVALGRDEGAYEEELEAAARTGG